MRRSLPDQRVLAIDSWTRIGPALAGLGGPSRYEVILGWPRVHVVVARPDGQQCASRPVLVRKAGIRRPFVVNWDRQLVGVVARRDLLRVHLNDDDQLRAQFAKLFLAALPGVVDVRDNLRHPVGVKPREKATIVPPTGEPLTRSTLLCER